MNMKIVVDTLTERTVEEARDLARFRGANVDKDTPFTVKSVVVPGTKPGTEVKKPMIVFRSGK